MASEPRAGAEGAAEEAKRCLPCEGLTETLSEAKVAEMMEGRSLWTLSEEGRMVRSFTARNFMAALAFINAAGEIAEREGHHPDLHITSYRDVTVELYTHSLGGLSENDFILAGLLDEIPVRYSPKWLREHPEAKPEGQA